MIPVQDVCASFQFTTDGLTDAARAKKVRELRERATVLGNIEPIEPLPDCPVRADITKTVLPGLAVMSGMLCGLRQAVRPKAISGGEDDLFLGVNLSGSSIAQQNDQELTLRDGDAVLMPSGYHPNVSIPGHRICFLWAMAAHREQEDRQFGVVNVQPNFGHGGSGLEQSRK